MQRCHTLPALTTLVLLLLTCSATAQDGLTTDQPVRGERLRRFMEARKAQREDQAQVMSSEALGAIPGNLRSETYGGRDLLIYVPSRLPTAGQRAMVVALHGGMGNARFMQQHLKMDDVAEKYGFLVAYLNGSPAARHLSDRFHAWNAGGGCCGKPYTDNVDDIGYISKAVHYLCMQYGVDPAQVFGTGHSNGAMMTLTMMCRSNLYQKAVSLAGSLMAEGDRCPSADGKAILAIHGQYDQNVLPEGGIGPKGISRVSFRSQVDSQARFQNSGGSYQIDWVESDHALEHLATAIEKRDGISLAEKMARYFGLTR